MDTMRGKIATCWRGLDTSNATHSNCIRRLVRIHLPTLCHLRAAHSTSFASMLEAVVIAHMRWVAEGGAIADLDAAQTAARDAEALERGDAPPTLIVDEATGTGA